MSLGYATTLWVAMPDELMKGEAHRQYVEVIGAASHTEAYVNASKQAQEQGLVVLGLYSSFAPSLTIH